MLNRILACALALFVLAGCSPYPMEDVFRMPELPEEFAEFNDQLNKIRAGGAEFTAPTSGYNRQSVQLMDLDNDGIDEGIAFVKESGPPSKVFVYVFKKVEDSYQILERIEGPGNTVESISYADLMGDGNFDMLIGWGVEDSSAKMLTAHEITKDGMRKLVEFSYLYFVSADMDGDGVADLNVVSANDKNNVTELAMYTAELGELRLHSAAPLSEGIEQVRKIRAGYATENTAGIFVDSAYGENSLVTDLVIYQDGRLRNVTLDDTARMSVATERKYAAYCEDVNGDGIIEIPAPKLLPGYEDARRTDVMWGILWRDFNPSGGLIDVAYSYHAYMDNWHLLMPLEWRGHITTERLTQDSGVIFYGVDSKGKRQVLFTIYVLTGESRYTKANYSGRVKIVERQNVVYAASIKQAEYLGKQIDEQSIRDMFHWRETEWSANEVVA